jgi:preprotein translocase subunit YajC
MGDDFITISVANNVEITIQKGAISNVLPKGTFKTVND